MSLTDLFMKFAKFFTPMITAKCTHDKVRPDLEHGYCPDCGKLIKNEWYITRCSCCGVKMKAVIKNGEIIPQEHFCSNCGSEEYSVERIEKINFIDIKFAVLKKQEVMFEHTCNTTRCWQEKTIEQPKLLVQYL